MHPYTTCPLLKSQPQIGTLFFMPQLSTCHRRTQQAPQRSSLITISAGRRPSERCSASRGVALVVALARARGVRCALVRASGCSTLWSVQVRVGIQRVGVRWPFFAVTELLGDMNGSDARDGGQTKKASAITHHKHRKVYNGSCQR